MEASSNYNVQLSVVQLHLYKRLFWLSSTCNISKEQITFVTDADPRTQVIGTKLLSVVE
jgi:hypothetical protein